MANEIVEQQHASILRHYMYFLAAFGITLLSLAGLGFFMDVIPVCMRWEKSRCLEELGCFTVEGEWSLRWFNALPQARQLISTKFLVFIDHQEYLEFSSQQYQAISDVLDPHKKTVVVIHGWISSRNDEALRGLLDALITSSGCNVILADWEQGSKEPYHQSAANTRVVGAEVASLLQYLQSSGRVNLTCTHLIGLSLGAHAAGYTGSILQGIGRITGLDAAGPLFETYPPSVRLDPSDAVFVDAIHTDGDSLANVIIGEGGLGIHHPIAHADFYPNGGQTQPHCAGIVSRTLDQLPNVGFSGVKKMVACDHVLSIDYFSQSLKGHTYFSFACDSGHVGFLQGQCEAMNVMGYGAQKPDTPTSYYLHMSEQHPYIGYHYLVQVYIPTHLPPPCLQFHIQGNLGKALPIPGSGECASDVHGSVVSAMLFSPQPVGSVGFLVLTSYPTPSRTADSRSIDVLNVRVTHNLERMYGCESISFTDGMQIKMALSNQECQA